MGRRRRSRSTGEISPTDSQEGSGGAAQIGRNLDSSPRHEESTRPKGQKSKRPPAASPHKTATTTTMPRKPTPLPETRAWLMGEAAIVLFCMLRISPRSTAARNGTRSVSGICGAEGVVGEEGNQEASGEESRQGGGGGAMLFRGRVAAAPTRSCRSRAPDTRPASRGGETPQHSTGRRHGRRITVAPGWPPHGGTPREIRQCWTGACSPARRRDSGPRWGRSGRRGWGRGPPESPRPCRARAACN